MNITISLLKRVGLTKEEVESQFKKVRDERDSVMESVKKLEKDISKISSDVDFWKRQLKKQSTVKKCTKCKEPVELWPFNDTDAYYVKGNSVTHQYCPIGKKK